VTYNISLIPDPTYKPTNDYVQCGDTDTQTGSISAVIAEAGNPFTKTCISNTSGGTIGETSATGYTYSWSPATGLTATNVSSPTANPSSTTTYTVTKTNTITGCSDTDTVEITVNNTAVTAEAGDPFTKTCVSNTSGGTIGEDAVVGFSYSWSPAAGLSATNVSNPTANPSSTTTYTVTKTTSASGCSDTDSVEISVNNTTVTAEAGDPFTKSCTSNINGKTIGEDGVAGFSYSWLPVAGLSATNVGNPTANPSSTTTYTVTKTNTSSGCSDTDTMTVTVNTDTPDDPTFCVVLPSLCDITKKGSLTILTPVGALGDYQYSIDNGTTWQDDTTFNGLDPGSITGVKVKNLANGCISNPVNCSDSNICTPSSPKTAETVVPIKTSIINKTDNVGFDAYPVPFKDLLNIKYKFDYKTDVKIEIFDLRGVLIQSKTDTDSYFDKEIMLELNFNVNKEQIYIVKVTTNRGSSAKKIISSN
ncbi:T9SS type A sorting domain-containing protein, partial [Flavobacterium sp.]|uniref:T9SS type A sorting domain-containing protein n=1 Tax=Flavobacterium sp. TaxID=239 RepID=UPI002B4B18C7